ncbi:DUF2029 domain-containing protein [Candidatus Dependentiae bacterium]|nr:DUF2029 domain-containing protein [Candidatus Dependentiae bacterium]
MAEHKKKHICITILLFCILIIIYFYGFQKLNQYKEKSLYFEDFFAQYEAAKNYKVFFRPYPPTTSLIYIPFIKIKYEIAADIFFYINIIILITCLFLAGSLIGLKKITEWNLLIFLSILFLPFFHSIIYGQINLLILLILMMIIKIDLSEGIPVHIKNCLIGALISSGAMIKLFPAFMILFFLIKKRFSVLIYVFLFSLFFICLTIWIYDLNTWVYYIKEVVPVTSKSWVILTVNNQSLLSLITRLLGRSLEFGVSSAVYIPALIKPVYFFIAIAYIIVYYYFFQKTKIILHQYCITILTGILIFGLNWHHTFSFVFFPAVYGLYYLLLNKEHNITQYFIWAAGFILLIVKIDFSVYKIHGFMHLITIPAYYGSLIILLLYFFMIKINAR